MIKKWSVNNLRVKQLDSLFQPGSWNSGWNEMMNVPVSVLRLCRLYAEPPKTERKGNIIPSLAGLTADSWYGHFLPHIFPFVIWSHMTGSVNKSLLTITWPTDYCEGRCCAFPWHLKQIKGWNRCLELRLNYLLPKFPNFFYYFRFGVLILVAVSMKVTFWGDLSPCSLVNNYQCFLGIFCLHVFPEDGN